MSREVDKEEDEAKGAIDTGGTPSRKARSPAGAESAVSATAAAAPGTAVDFIAGACATASAGLFDCVRSLDLPGAPTVHPRAASVATAVDVAPVFEDPSRNAASPAGNPR